MKRRALIAALPGLAALLPWRARADEPMTRDKAAGILREFDRITSDNGVDEAKAVTIGGIQQWITVRGRDRRNPILLLLHGGPAAPELANRYLFEGPWTDYFTVVEWDQRGAGKTYALNDPAVVGPTIGIDRMEQDAQELAAWLRQTYQRDKIFVMAHSWGTILGMRMAMQKPQWLHAYVGIGQMINTREAEKIGYDFAVQAAARDHNDKALAELKAILPYPEADGSLPIEKIGVQRKWNLHYGGLTHGRSSYDYWDRAQALSPDYTEAEVAGIDKGSALSLPRLLPDMAKANFDGVRRLECPVVMFAGRYDYTTPSALIARWFDRLSAPSKRLVWFENSAHMVSAEEPGRMLVHLVQDVLPYARGGP